MGIKSIDNMDFDTLYDTYADQVYQTALHYSRNPHVAEEITQMVFAELIDYESDINLENAEAWFYTIARNKTRNYFRDIEKELLVENIRLDMKNIVHIEGFDNMNLDNCVDDYYIEKLTKEKRLQFLEKIYDDLYKKNDRWYVVIMAVYILEIPQKTVAEKLGISIGSLQVMLSRAKKWIRNRYQKEFDRLEDE